MTRVMLLLLCAVVVPACYGGDECLFFDDYPPPSATFKLRDAETNELLCNATVSAVDRPGLTRDEERCEYRLPVWFPKSGAGHSVTLQVAGYFEERIRFPAERDDCGRLQEPPPRTIEVTPDPNYDP